MGQQKSEIFEEALIISALYLGLLVHKIFIWPVAIVLIYQIFKNGFKPRNKFNGALYFFFFPCYIVLPGLIIDLLGGEFLSGLKQAEPRIIIIIVILAMIYLPYFNDRNKNIRYFIWIVLGMVIYSIWISFYQGFIYRGVVIHQWDYLNTVKFYKLFDNTEFNWAFLFYKKLTETVGYDPLYLGLIIFLGILGSVSLIFSGQPSSKCKYIWYFTLFVFTIYLCLISAKAPLLLLILSSLIFICFRFRKAFSVLSLKIFLPLIILLGFGFALVPEFIFRIRNESFPNNISIADNLRNDSFSDSRISIWKVSSEIVCKKPISGFGLAGGRRFSESYFLEKQIPYYNSHSEWLNTILTSGILALVLCLLSIMFISQHVWTARSVYFIVTCLSIFLIMSIENLFTRFHGCVWYSLTLLLFLPWEHYLKAKGFN
ncbi:MAG: O-antigen ligase family protein [Bacteroidetes bacterium]|nr:O-antigen ligase family protein [Bacteroidota bacterium]